MRTNRLFFCLIAMLQAILLISCNEEERELQLSETSIAIDLRDYPEKTLSVFITGGSGEYSAKTSNPDVAEVEIKTEGQDSYLLITWIWLGEAVLTVTDEKTGKTASCSFIFIRTPITGTFTLVNVKYGVDADQKEIIETDLQQNQPFPLKSTLTFENYPEGDKGFIIAPDKTELANGSIYPTKKEEAPASYDLVPIDKQFYFKYLTYEFILDEKEIIYDGIVVSETVNGLFTTHIRFYEDLTDHYHTLFPDAGVKGVVRVQYFDYIYD